MISAGLAGWRAGWDRFWFAPASARSLAVVRIVTALEALWVLLSRDFAGISALPAAFWDGVRGTTRWRFLLFPGHQGLELALTVLAALLLLAVAIGLRPRLAALGAALLLYHLAPLESIVWTPSPHGRGLTLATLTLLACAAAPSGDALAWRARGTPAPSWRYGWPLRLVQCWLVAVYFWSGVGKLRASGVAFASADNMTRWLRMMSEFDGLAVHTTIGTWLAGHGTVAAGLGALALLFELASPLALVSRRLRPWFGVIAIGFHLTIVYAMNITLNSWPLLVAFFEWDRDISSAPTAARP